MIKRHSTREFSVDYAQRINPRLMTRLLRKAVPVLEHTNWKITKVKFGFCETVLPLNVETTNQHGTHQAALISLSADYTGGMALTSILTGVPLSGIHRCVPEEAASLWLASMDVKYLQPSTGHLIGRCKIDPDQIEATARRYMQGKRILVSLPIEFESNGVKVAEAKLKYFAQPTIQLLNAGSRSTLFTQKIKASARMIAGVRASSSSSSRVRVDCPHAKLAAGPHGEMLAKKVKQALPQLTEMVLARTRHIDETILCSEKSQSEIRGTDFEQVVMLGAGLDMRPFRICESAPGIRYFEVDLPEMLVERKRVVDEIFNELNKGKHVPRQMIPANFLEAGLDDKILSQSDFDPSKPTLFVYEGCSMYFSDSENIQILESVRRLAKNKRSKIWCDFVTTNVVTGKTDRREIESFLQRMDDMGESFVFGCDLPEEFLSRCGWSVRSSQTAAGYLKANDGVFDVYQFCVGGIE